MAKNLTNPEKADDLQAWQQYKQTGTKKDKYTVLKRMEPLINKQVRTWSGPVPDQVLRNKARVLAAKALDTYDPNKGTALATHVVNNLAPISRVVYTHQNTSRLPENITLRLRAYLEAKDNLEAVLGREPTVDELHQELGWTAAEIQRLETYRSTDLIESVGGVSGDFYSDKDDTEEDMLVAIYTDLAPQEKLLLEHTTGYGGKKILSNPELCKKFNITQAQLSYRKTLLTNKINALKLRRRV